MECLEAIDALELAIHLKNNYQILIKVEDEDTRKIFASLKALACYVQDNVQQQSAVETD